jgi:hypothetical protein
MYYATKKTEKPQELKAMSGIHPGEPDHVSVLRIYGREKELRIAESRTPLLSSQKRLADQGIWFGEA